MTTDNPDKELPGDNDRPQPPAPRHPRPDGGARDRFTRMGVTPEAGEAMLDAVRAGMSAAAERGGLNQQRDDAMLTPLDQHFVALREYYVAMRRAGFSQDEAFDYLSRHKK